MGVVFPVLPSGAVDPVPVSLRARGSNVPTIKPPHLTASLTVNLLTALKPRVSSTRLLSPLVSAILRPILLFLHTLTYRSPPLR